MNISTQLRRNLFRFLLTSMAALGLSAFVLPGMVSAGNEYWIVLGLGILAFSLVASFAWVLAQYERGKLPEERIEHLNRYLDDGWPLFVIMIPVLLGGIIRSYFPSLTGLLTIPLGILLLGTMIWAWQHRRESKLRRKS